MKLLSSSAYKETRWKNGGGITHEILAVPDSAGYHWRLSIAEVASDGAFSNFPGLQRILTVISGAGLDLQSPERKLRADIFEPVEFSGDEPITGILRNGAIQDLNLIFDPRHVTGQVTVLTNIDRHEQPEPNETCVLFCARGTCDVADVAIFEGDCALWKDETVSLSIPDGALALLVKIGAKP